MVLSLHDEIGQAGEAEKRCLVKRFLAVLVLVVLMASSSCTAVVEGVKISTEGRGWRELLLPTPAEMWQQITENHERVQQRVQDPKVRKGLACDFLWTAGILGGMGGALNAPGIIPVECLPSVNSLGIIGATDVPQDLHPHEGPEDR